MKTTIMKLQETNPARACAKKQRSVTLSASTNGFLGVALIYCASLLALSGQTNYQPIKSFRIPELSGSQRRSPLIKASDGKVYGTTFSGGTAGAGTLFTVNSFGADITREASESSQQLGLGSRVPMVACIVNFLRICELRFGTSFFVTGYFHGITKIFVPSAQVFLCMRYETKV